MRWKLRKPKSESRLATRVTVASMTFMITQQRTCAICNPKLMAVFLGLKKRLKGQSDCKDVKFYHFIGEGNRSYRGCNCEAKFSREHF